MVLVAVLVFLLMREIMPIAAALAGGVALSTLGLTSRFVGWGMRRERGGCAARSGPPHTRCAPARPPSAAPAGTVERANWGAS